MLTALYHSPYTGDGNWTNGPGIFPHYVVLRKVVTGGKVISGPLARSAGWACELISQVFMRLAGCTDPAAVFTWETGIWAAEYDSLRFFSKGIPARYAMSLWQKKKEHRLLPACIFFISLRSQGSLHWEVGTASLGQWISSLLRLRVSAHSPTGT